MGTTTNITTGIGASDQIINNNGGALNDTNVAAQLAASAAALGAISTPGGALTAVTASEAAFSTGLAVLDADITANKPITDLLADGLTLVGDVSIFTGALAAGAPQAAGAERTVIHSRKLHLKTAEQKKVFYNYARAMVALNIQK
jgi:hypothetical protein